MPRPSETRLAPSGDRSSASRKSNRHRNHSHNHTQSSHSTPRSVQVYNYHDLNNMQQTNGDDESHAQTNGYRQPRREPANAVFVDFQFYDPPEAAQAGAAMAPGMVIRATSNAEYATAVADSSAIAYLYREGEDMPVLNGTAQATARMVDPDPALDLGVAEGTVTVQYEWDQLAIYQPGTYCYRVLVSGKADDDHAVGLGVYDSGKMEVSP